LYVSATHSVVNKALVIKKETSQMEKNCEATVPSLFHFGGLSRVQEVLFRGEKDYSESSNIILRLTL
jgi:hypothetical protein